MRYEGFYQIADPEQLSPLDFKAFKTKLFQDVSKTKIDLWDTLKINKKYKSFQDIAGRSTTRQSRQEYAFRRFGRYFGSHLLDVGCDAGVLKEFFQGKYVGIDCNGTPDVLVDLESKEKLPFSDNQFDCAVALEVLEHIDQLHAVLRELVRVSNRYILLTLPNCWRQLFGDILLGRSTRSEYGLPPEKPIDRHKWFFNTEEAEDFIAYQCHQLNCRLVDVEYTYNVGDLFCFNLDSFYYPPRAWFRELFFLHKLATLGVASLEKIIKFFLFFWRRAALKNIEVVNVWFVLEKTCESTLS